MAMTLVPSSCVPVAATLKMEDRDSFNILDTKEHRKQLESYCHNLLEK